MRVDSVRVTHFRSIEDVELSRCGDFNVLIGKNGSGKSAILAALGKFFSRLKEPKVFSAEPSGCCDQPDFRNGDLGAPICVSVVITLPPDEAGDLLENVGNDILAAVPEAVEDLTEGSPLVLEVSVAFHARPFIHSVVQRIAVHSEVHGRVDILDIRQRDLSPLLRDAADSSLVARVPEFIDLHNWAPIASAKPENLRQALGKRLGKVGPKVTSLVTQLVEMANGSYSTFSELLRTLLDRPVPSFPDFVEPLLAFLSRVSITFVPDYRQSIGDQEAAQLQKLKETRDAKHRLRTLHSKVSALLGIDFDTFRDDLGNPELDIEGFQVAINGSGFQEGLRFVMITELLEPDVLLIEEPEMHLHPALETTVIDHLRDYSREHQVFLATHSVNFVDVADVRNVYVVTKEQSTQVQSIEYEKAIEVIPEELGLRLSSMLMFERLIFVEGSSDENVFRQWAAELGFNLGRVNVGFVRMGGIGNYRYFAAEEVLSVLTKRRVRVWVVVDRDGKNEASIESLRKMLGGRATLRVLQRRQLENYLICPEAIARLIRRKKGIAGEAPSRDELQRAINESIDSLKNNTVDKRVRERTSRPVYPSKQSKDAPEANIVEAIMSEIRAMIAQCEELCASLDDVYDREAKVVNEKWDSAKVEMVPGDAVLESVLRRYDLHFCKGDDAELAGLMESGEIHDDIKDILKEICG